MGPGPFELSHATSNARRDGLLSLKRGLRFSGGLVLATSVSLGTKSGVSRDTSSAGQGAGSGGQPSPLRGLLMRPR